MKVKVLYFAVARELAASDSEVVSLDAGATVSDLRKKVFGSHSKLKRLRGSARFSVNLEVATDETRLSDGDTVGLLPAVGGG